MEAHGTRMEQVFRMSPDSLAWIVVAFAIAFNASALTIKKKPARLTRSIALTRHWLMKKLIEMGRENVQNLKLVVFLEETESSKAQNKVQCLLKRFTQVLFASFTRFVIRGPKLLHYTCANSTRDESNNRSRSN